MASVLRSRMKMTPTPISKPTDSHWRRRTRGLLRLLMWLQIAPPFFAGQKMGGDDLTVQLGAGAGLVVDLDIALLDIGPIQLQDLVHPATFTGGGLAD